jgi:phenylpropionate dioxygenase-like ring-hydroxylating dioxygenase large terminal subunit
MLSREDNQLLTRVEPGTPMGALFRRFWIPVLLAEELPRPDGDPVRVRILGEDLIAFRDSSGRVGLVQNNCPHRGASLFFASTKRVACVACTTAGSSTVRVSVSTCPTSPPNQIFAPGSRRLRTQLGRGGLIWAYMGPPEQRPALPDLEFALVPDKHRYVTKYPLDCNYMQGMEGELDSSHVSFLHSSLKAGSRNALDRVVPGHNLLELTARDGHPRVSRPSRQLIGRPTAARYLRR